MSGDAAAEVLALLVRRGATVAVAESLTAGLIGATLTGPAGASAAFRGGVIVYATDLKARLLGVPEGLLDREGAVHPEVAAAMAAGVRRVTGSTFGLAVTGVAGPDPQDGKPVGTVHIAVAGPDSEIWHRDVLLSGSREHIRKSTVTMGLELLRGVLEAQVGEQSG
ncbi:competence damage-inducible protein A [Sphaerisporangium melleum]|uniref:Competence damage-inducible protein A n=1 Tax=Sphaerisporangium melleum TaxID=321316 RepID=A0A917R1V7_9ACTN|nr:nicotinamide-nucleotide amidohydrolase family protein [Sphaerisporangium melleum]GGK83136.1 competence damage-inducible protein A [Sphaerisporangium melleum]GII69244.1 competence damage-inducible protein A [Sphaerisporangium melleum]